MTAAPPPVRAGSVKIKIGPERRFMDGALQPFMLHTRRGRLLVTAQMPVPMGTAFPGVYQTMTSDDGGASWQTWKRDDIKGGSPFFEGCARELSDGTILLFEWSAKGPHEGGYWHGRLWESRDNFETVRGPTAAPMHVPRAKGGFDDDGHPAGEIFLHRSLLELPSGELIMSAYGWFVGDDTPSTYRPSMNKLRTILLRSSDRGRTWTYGATIAYDPAVGEESFNEPAIVRVTRGPRAGTLIAHLRTGSNKTFKRNPIYQTESTDDGHTWTDPRPLDLLGNVDPDLIEMKSGVLVATNGLRTAESRVNLTSEPKDIGPGHGNYIAFSLDGGQTWVGETRVTDDPSTCYTCVAEIAPNKLAFVYDIGDAWQHVWVRHPNMYRGLGIRIIEVEV